MKLLVFPHHCSSVVEAQRFGWGGEGLAVLCCWEAFGQLLCVLWERRWSSGLGRAVQKH